MYYETAANDHGLPHDPFLSCVVPRPIGWVTTCDREGRTNLAPFSFFNGVGTCPPQVMFSTVGTHADGGPKDSCANAETTGEFVINMATWALREEMNLTSAYVAHGVDEASLAGLDMAPSRLVAPPRVKRSPIHLECRYSMSVRLPATDPEAVATVVFGTVVCVHIQDDVLTEGRVDVTKIRPIARLGYMEYATIEQTFAMERPTVGERPGHHLNRELMNRT